MLKAGDDPRFGLEALPQLRTIGPMRRQHSDVDRAIQPAVVCAVYLSCSAGTDDGLDLVRSELSACGEGHFAVLGGEIIAPRWESPSQAVRDTPDASPESPMASVATGMPLSLQRPSPADSVAPITSISGCGGVRELLERRRMRSGV